MHESQATLFLKTGHFVPSSVSTIAKGRTCSFANCYNNAKIKRAAIKIIEGYGYRPTTICTPEELVGASTHDG